MSQAAHSPRIVQRPTKEVPIIPGPSIQGAGVIIDPANLSPAEWQALKGMGWDGESPVPSNLPDLLGTGQQTVQQALDPALAKAIAAAEHRMPAGFEMPKKPLDISKIPTITDEAVVAEELSKVMDKYASVVNAMMPQQAAPAPNAFEAARQQGVAQIQQSAMEANINPRLAPAMRELEASITDGSIPETPTQDQSPVSAPPVQEPAAPPKPVDIFQTRLDRVNKEDAEKYRISLITMSRFEKTYDLLGGAIKVTFGDISPDDDMMIIHQEAIDRFKGRFDRMDMPSFLDTSARYTFAAMLREVHIVEKNVKPVEIPARLTLAEYLATLDRGNINIFAVDKDDTNIRMWYRFLASKALTGSLYNAVYKKFEEFRTLATDLQLLSQDPRFFGTPAQ